jgi:gamma-glutamylcyclotransferase (GGCT)/AIG2-like uncharacterized protein YtfP
MDLFFYGSLTDPGLLKTLTGKHFATEPARLSGYQRVRPKRGYPYVRPHDGHSVHGVLVRDVDEHSRQRLDEYEGEGELYLRTMVFVEAAARTHPCEVYLANPSLLTDEGEWKLAALQV